MVRDDQGRGLRRYGYLPWSVFLLYPAWQLVSSHLPPTDRLTAAFGLLVLAGGFIAFFLCPVSQRARLNAFFMLAAVAGTAALYIGLKDPSLVDGVLYGLPAFLAVRSPRRLLILTGAIVAGAVAAGVHSHAGLGYYLGDVVDIPVFFLVGYGFRRHLEVRTELRQAEEEIAALAVANERLRIARELHDVLGHTLSVMALRADVAAYEIARDPAAAESEMRRVAELAREALSDVRAVVAGVRATSLAEEWARAQEVLRAAGIAVSATGIGLPLSPSEERTLAYVVREAVTNVLKHARARNLRLEIARQPDGGIALTVEDDGRGAPLLQPGHGLVGMSERVAELDGELEVDAEDGFRLRVRLPALPTEVSRP